LSASDAGGARLLRGCLGADAHEIEPERADRDLVPVLQLAPVDALPVEEHAVEAAVVKDAGPAAVAVDQRMTPRHGRVVEAEVRRQAAADAGPAVLKRHDPHAVLVVEGDVITLADECSAGVRQPVRLQYIRHLVELVRQADGHEHRGAFELAAAALRATRHLVQLMKRHSKAARLAPERTGPCERAG